jgi:hypothetical protein
LNAQSPKESAAGKRYHLKQMAVLDGETPVQF